MSDREELFKKAKEKVDQEKSDREAKKASGGGNFDYEEMTYVGLEYDKAQIVRVLGNPKAARNGDPYSARDVLISRILGDNDKQFRYVWPLKGDNPNWILWKIFDKVMAYKWDKSLGAKGGRVYLNADSHSSVFNRVSKNNDVENVMESGWKPALHIVMNVLDRHEMDWHKENKHSKLLSKKVNIGKEGRVFAETGIPESLYNSIWDNVVENYGDWENYDIALLKKKTGPNTSDVEYSATQASLDKLKMPEFKFLAPVKDFIVEAPLTDEEKSWEKYDIDKLFKITSYQKILKNLGIFIQSVDASFKTKYYEELKALAEEEKAKFAEAREGIKESKEEEPEAPKSESIKEPIPARASRAASVEKFDLSRLDKTIFKGITSLPSDFKDMITGIEEGQLTFKKEAGTLLQCETCKSLSPELFTSCPKCGVTF